MQIGDSGRIPNFIKAKTPKQLRRMMLRNNVQKSAMFDYYQIVWTGTEWIAWYIDQTDNLIDDLTINKRGNK